MNGMKYVEKEEWLRGVRALGKELLEEVRRHPKKVWPNWENFPVKVALMHAELSEALEAHRCAFVEAERDSSVVGLGDALTERLAERQHEALRKMEEELADLLIYVVQTGAGLRMNLGEAVLRKVAKNWKREIMHSGKSY